MADETLDPVHKALNAFKPFVVPRAALHVGKTEHQIQTESVAAVFLDKRVGTHDVAARLTHFLSVGTENGALMHKRFKGLVEIEISHIAQRFREEARIKQVHTGMFRAADVFVDRQHFIYLFATERFFVVFGIDVS